MTDIPMQGRIASHGVSMSEAFKVWLRVALLFKPGIVITDVPYQVQ